MPQEERTKPQVAEAYAHGCLALFWATRVGPPARTKMRPNIPEPPGQSVCSIAGQAKDVRLCC